MSWIDVLDHNQFLRSLFPSSDPPLDAVRLHEIKLHQDGPTVILRFDLNEYPAVPPTKWRAAMSNTVQVCVAGITVRELAIRGWTCNNIGRLVFERGVDTIDVEFDAGGCRVAATFEHVWVNSVTAYHKEPDTST